MEKGREASGLASAQDEGGGGGGGGGSRAGGGGDDDDCGPPSDAVGAVGWARVAPAVGPWSADGCAASSVDGLPDNRSLGGDRDGAVVGGRTRDAGGEGVVDFPSQLLHSPPRLVVPSALRRTTDGGGGQPRVRGVGRLQSRHPLGTLFRTSFKDQTPTCHRPLVGIARSWSIDRRNRRRRRGRRRR